MGSRRLISVVPLTALLVALLAASSDAKPRCHGHTADIVGGRGANNLQGTAGPDVIVGGAGSDRIDGRRGFDLICAGRGADLVLGENGGDIVFGGAGADRLYGELQNDKLVGGTGPDVLIGGEAFNALLGGPGDDFMRDGQTIDGGPGSDWISFADRARIGTYRLSPSPNLRQRGLENVVGTWFKDELYGTGQSGAVRGLGFPRYGGSDPTFYADYCEGFAHTECGGPVWLGNQPTVLYDPTAPDPGIAVVGGSGDDHLTISRSTESLRVASDAPMAALPGCLGGGTRNVECRIPGQLGYVTVFTQEGNDAVTIQGTLGASVTVAVDGGLGSDALTGGPGDEELDSGFDVPGGFPGPDGQPIPTGDVVSGGRGNDSLSAGYAGPDRVYGGPGTDQLSSPNPCGGAVLDGGSGSGDIANFSPSNSGVRARLGRDAVAVVTPRAQCNSTQLARATELLEGTEARDVLIGDGRPNFIAGHGGDDLIKGLGGNDNLVGEGGRDRLIGGGGSDRLDCGAGGGVARHDSKDPRSRGCR